MATTTQGRPAPLETPLSATFPSEIQSPAIASPTFLKREEVQKTPITPPAAYLDFLQKMTTSPTWSPPPSASLIPSFPTPRPALTSNPSEDTVSSLDTVETIADEGSSELEEKLKFEEKAEHEEKSGSERDTGSEETSKAPSPRLRSSSITTETIPRSEFAKPERPSNISVAVPASPYSPGPGSARSLKRLVIPGSPYSPRCQTIISPSIRSPIVGSPLSAGVVVSPFAVSYSPRESRDFDRVGLRQTITRYISLPNKPAPVMEPVPASKKRKLEQA